MKTVPKKNDSNSASNKIKLVYVIGRYPELTTTFIDREIKTLHKLGNTQIQTVSIRYPLTQSTQLSEYQETLNTTRYLVPKSWRNFNWKSFITANFRFVLSQPLVYTGTLIYLLTHNHPNLKSRLTTIFHFWQGVYAAHLLSSQNFDHIHAHFIDRAVIVALVMGRLLKKPYSLTAHANSIFVKRILIREKIENAKFMVTVSEHNKAHLLNTYPGLNPNKIHILHPWVDLSHFTPSATRKFCKQLHILGVGRLVEKKGFIYLVEACQLLQKQGIDFKCRIVGEGPLKSKLQECIIHYGLEDQVQLMGGQPQNEVLRLLDTWANVFVLPCVIAKDGDRDGIPVSLAEAMAMELPVISTDIVGISELVQPNTGLLVLPHDPTALAKALHAIYNKNESERAEMGRQGRAVVEAEFNLIKGTAQLGNLFRGIMTVETSVQSSNIAHED